MADFRRVVIALAVLALMTGLAVSANAQAFSCSASAAVPPLLRAEGMTELTGDIVLNCTGGTAPTGPGLPVANVTVFLGNTTVTSRIINDDKNATEALLLVDEPVGGAISVASDPLLGCSACTVAGPNPNAFHGIYNSAAPNSITFIGVPVVPPGTAAGSTPTRILRITNIRANASAVGAGSIGNLSSSQLQAFVSISGSTSIPLNNPLQTVGFIQPGLNFSVRKADPSDPLGSAGFGIQQCVSASRTSLAAVLRYTEGFATAFKPRGTTGQSTPGSIYNTETGFVAPSDGVATSRTALASFSTRLKATFSNIPTGVTVYVSNTNINGATRANLVGTDQGASFGSTVSAATTINIGSPAVAYGFSSVSGTAVWEVNESVSSLTLDSLDFGVSFATTANPGGNSPAVGVTGQVSGSFAPTYVPPAGTTATSSNTIPRFIGSVSATNLVVATICRTNILFPFVTNQVGFDTGLAIANTSKDPYGTTTQAGTCDLNFYGDNAPAKITTASVAAGTVYTTGASAVAPNFQGYVIAVCNFQLAHGFAFVQSSVGYNPSTAAMGYLGLILPEVPRNIPTAGEVLGQ